MDTFRVIALRHYLSLPENQIRLILWVIDNHRDELLNNIDLRYFACRGIPAVKEELKTFQEVDDWLHNAGLYIYKKAKENQFIRFGRNWDKMVKRITNI